MCPEVLQVSPNETNTSPLLRRWLIFVCSFMVFGAWSGQAAAEQSGADALFSRGVRALRADQFDEAISLFRLSYDMEPRASTMCNLALAYERSERLREALESYRRCAEDDMEGRFRSHAYERARDLERRLDARREPLVLQQQQGPPRVIPVHQQPPQIGQPRPYPTQGYQVQPQVIPGQTPTYQPQRRAHVFAWVGIGVGVLSLGCLGTAIGLNVWSNNVYDEVYDQYGFNVPAGSSTEDRVERGRSGRNAALGLYIGGGISGALAIVFLILDAARVDPSRRVVRVAAAPTDGGFAVSASFQLSSAWF